MGIASLFKGKVSPQQVSNAYDFACQVMSCAKDPMDALHKGNVTPDFIDKVKPILNLPFIGEQIRNRLGLDKGAASQMLDQIKQGLNNQSSAAKAPADDLSVYRNAISRLGK